MRTNFLSFFLAFLLGAPCVWAQCTPGPLITSTLPAVVNQGTTFTFTASGGAGTWSCSGTNSSGAATACAGSINSSTGVYTAPASVTAKQTLGGMQLLPNNSIFNTNISAFPLRSDSAALIAAAGTSTLKFYEIAKPINYTNGSTPTQSMVFFYHSPFNNGTYQIPTFPGSFPTDARAEGGWVPAINNSGGDHHLLSVDTTNGNMQDIYNHYTTGLNSSCPTCTAQSGVKYTTASYALPANGASDASGMYLTPLLLRLQEMEQAVASGGDITHALRMTIANGFICSSSTANACAGNAAGNRFIWPATDFATEGGGVLPYGLRFRLKSSYNISGYSTIAQILLRQLKNYGLILADGGTSWSVDIEYDGWPKPILDALIEVSFGNITPSNFEVVDESGFQTSPYSNECNCNRETVTFTRTSDGAVASTDVVLTGVAVNFPYNLQQIQVGAPATTFAALVNIGSVTYSMSPGGTGTLNSSTGLYTPPVSLSVPTTLTVTATSNVNSAIAASFTLNVFPAGTIRLIPGNKPGTFNYTLTPTNYTDTSSNVWYAGLGFDGGYSNGIGTITGTTDPTLYVYEFSGWTGGANDVRFDIIVPNASYTITYKAATANTAAGQQLMNLELNGTNVATNFDLFASAGHLVAYDHSYSVTVTNNRLSFVQRIVNNAGTDIGSLQVTSP